MPKDEITIADILKKEGYSTGVFGKWHLGLTEPFYPTSRGFDDFYGFLGHGAHDYFDLSCTDKPDDFHQCIMRNNQKIDDKGYLTDNLGREACEFIRKNTRAQKPFFCYLPFNAVHWPLQAPAEDIKKFNTGNKNRDIYLAMLHRMDLAIGKVIETLKEEGAYANTIVVFLSDNGGAKKVNANNLPLRDYKQSVYEGGLRVPFVISWPERFKPSKNDEPVISFDIMPTICDILDIELPSDRIYDGRSILPVMEGRQAKPLHETLFWDGNENKWAVRQGDMKLVSIKGKLELYHLKNDLSEQNDLSAKHPEKVAALKNKYVNWRNEMAKPMGN
jgi:arylsulfatase A-like enzyme